MMFLYCVTTTIVEYNISLVDASYCMSKTLLLLFKIAKVADLRAYESDAFMFTLQYDQAGH